MNANHRIAVAGVVLCGVLGWTAPVQAQVPGGSLGGTLGGAGTISGPVGTIGSTSRAGVNGSFESTVEGAGTVRRARKATASRVQSARDHAVATTGAVASHTTEVAASTAASTDAAAGVAAATAIDAPSTALDAAANANINSSLEPAALSGAGSASGTAGVMSGASGVSTGLSTASSMMSGEASSESTPTASGNLAVQGSTQPLVGNGNAKAGANAGGSATMNGTF